MEFIIEFIVELLFEGSFELSKTKKTPKWLRYPLIIFITILFIGIFSIIFITAYLSIKENLIIGYLLLLIGTIFLIYSIKKFKNIYIKRDPNSKESKMWNKFIEQICTQKLKDLNEIQKNAVICFWYDCEMQSKGHSGVFDVYPIFKKDSEIVYKSIKTICNKKIADNYLDALKNIDSDFETQDNKYYDFSPCVTEYLEEYVINNQDDIFDNKKSKS